uniref:Olfactory receptor 5G3-like n=2 Tax=Strigops habroptila TaxID=2489341 RepID=A0A672V2M3_STRHB
MSKRSLPVQHIQGAHRCRDEAGPNDDLFPPKHVFKKRFNCTQVTEFSLAGFTEEPVTQVNLFLLFLLTYLVTILGNLGIIILIRASPQLHSPMYYFLGNLAFVDLWFSTIITPKMLVDLMSETKSIAYAGCVAQVFLFQLFGMTEYFLLCYLLAAMAYDRYVAISNPLLYTAAMSKRLCIGLVATSYLSGFANSTLITSCTFTLSFCHSNVINDFFCDLLPLVKLSCDVTDSYQSLLYFILTSNIILPSTFILVSYASILAVILKMRSSEGQHKAFSTSATHLTTVALYYGSILFIYARPSSSYVLGRDKVVSVVYTVVIPMLNPFIYSLRNQEVKEALKTLLKRQTKCTYFSMFVFSFVAFHNRCRSTSSSDPQVPHDGQEMSLCRQTSFPPLPIYNL